MLRFSRRLELYLLLSIPSILAVFCTLLYLIPKPISGLESVMPILPLLPVFYWGMLHARAIPYVLVFCIGMVIDATTSQILGPSSLLFMLFLYLTEIQRRTLQKEGFLAKWICLTVLLLIVTILKWLLLSWYYAQAMPFVPAIVQWALTVACYPVGHLLFDLFEHHIHTRKWDILHG